MPSSLDRWSRLLAAPNEGPGIELLGTSQYADPYPSLLWNGARLDLLADPQSLSLTTGLSLVSWTCGQAPTSEIARVAVRAGLQAADGLRSSHLVPSPDDLTAEVTTWVLPAAVTAWTSRQHSASSSPSSWPPALADLAASVMVTHPPATGPVSPDSPARNDEAVLVGHALAAGWLVPVLHEAGIIAPPNSSEQTVATILGSS